MSEDTCAGKFPLMSMGGRANGQACADGERGPPSARAEILLGSYWLKSKFYFRGLRKSFKSRLIWLLIFGSYKVVFPYRISSGNLSQPTLSHTLQRRLGFCNFQQAKPVQVTLLCGRFQGWVPMLGPKVGSQSWVPRLGPMVGSNGRVPGLGPKVGSQGWVPRLDPKVGSPGWVPWLGLKVGSQVRSQGRVPMLGPKVWSQSHSFWVLTKALFSSVFKQFVGVNFIWD